MFWIILICFQILLSISNGADSSPNQSLYFAADACPSIGNLKETTLEPSSNEFHVTCCDSSSGCVRHINSCSQWQQDKLSHSSASFACEQLGSGFRLCTKDELLGDQCCNKGCGSNSAKVWTSDTVSATTYYVDGNRGNDQNDGTKLRKAFKTIQRCVDNAQPLDTCLIRRGRYHESIQIHKKSNLVLKGFKKDKPIIDGSVVLNPQEGKWSMNEEGVCSGTIDEDVYQLFMDDDMMTNARWPNALWKENDDGERRVFDSTYWGHSSEASTKGRMVEKDGLLAESNLNMTGAMAVLNTCSWATSVQRVDSHNPGSNFFQYSDEFESQSCNFKPSHNRFYLDSKIDLLDNAGEWHYEKTTKMLSFMPFGTKCPDPRSDRVRGKTLDYGMNVTDTKNLTVENMTFFASSFVANSESLLTENIILDSVNFYFPSSSKRMLGKIDLPKWTQINSKFRQERGYFEITNCKFYGGEGAALSYQGLRPKIHNNEFKWNDWTGQLSLQMHGGYGTVFGDGVEEEVSFNTFENNGCMTTFNPYASTRPKVMFNRVVGTGFGSIQNDGSGIHFQIKAQNEGVIHNNWVYDTPKFGIRTDAATVSADMNLGEKTDIQNNVVFNTNRGFMLKGDNHTIRGNLALQNGNGNNECSLCIIRYMHNFNLKELSPLMNNRSDVENNAAWLADGGRRPGWKPYNGGRWGLPEGAKNTYSNSEVENLLVDPENYDFRPNPDNEMTIDDEGNFIGPYSPMIGSHLMDPMDPTSSYEGNYWIPGHRSNKASFPIPPHKAAIRKMRDVVMCQTGYKSNQHNFYIGVRSRAVKKANTNSPEFKGTFSNGKNVFPVDAALLTEKPRGPIYWRVDAIDEYGKVIKGNVWKFRVKK